jgi:Anti-sigma-K factor rskA
MTHDEFLKIVGAPSLTPDQQREMREHVAGCPECLSAHAAEGGSSLISPWWLAVAAVLFLALWMWREVGIRVARENLRSERAEVVELTSEKDVVTAQKEKLTEELGVISAPGVRVVELHSRDGKASARLFIDAATHRGVLLATGLAENGSENDYQLWVYGADPAAAKSVGTFDATNDHSSLTINDLPVDLKSVAVTLEKNGGSDKPGANVVLSGTI